MYAIISHNKCHGPRKSTSDNETISICDDDDDKGSEPFQMDWASRETIWPSQSTSFCESQVQAA